MGVKDMCDALREIGPSAMREVSIEVPKVHSELFSLLTLLPFVWYRVIKARNALITHTQTGVLERHWWARGGQTENEGGS